MGKPSSDIAFTPNVKALQERFGSRGAYAKMEENGGFKVEITTAKVVLDDPKLMEKVTCPSYKSKPEWAFLIHVKAWDTNCPQHINPRFTEAEIEVLDICSGCEPKTGD